MSEIIHKTMPKVAPKEEYILLHEDKAKFDRDMRSYEDLKNTINALSIELAARFRKPSKAELDAIASGNTKSEIQNFIANYYNANSSPIKLSFDKAIELMQIDMVRIYQLSNAITSRQKRVLKEPQIEQYRYFARTPEQISRYKKLSSIVDSIKELYEENKIGLNSRFLSSFAVGSSNALLTNGVDLTVNYRWILSLK